MFSFLQWAKPVASVIHIDNVRITRQMKEIDAIDALLYNLVCDHVYGGEPSKRRISCVDGSKLVLVIRDHDDTISFIFTHPARDMGTAIYHRKTGRFVYNRHAHAKCSLVTGIDNFIDAFRNWALQDFACRAR